MSSNDRKRQLLEIGRQCFASWGYVQTTTAMIAGAAGCSEPVLYQHFRSKRDLFHEILIEALDGSRKRFETVIAAKESGAEKVIAIIADFPAHNDERRELFRMIETAHASMDDPRTAEIMREYYDGYALVLESLIAEGKHDGSIREDVSPRTLAWFLSMSGLGYCLLSGLGTPVLRNQAFIDQVVALVTDLLAGPRDR